MPNLLALSAVARGIIAKELGKIVYFVLTTGEAYDGTLQRQSPEPKQEKRVAAPPEP